MLETLWQDLRFGARMLRRSPGFTFVAVFALALGIGANTAIFSVVNAILLRPLPYPNAAQLVRLHRTRGDDSAGRSPFSYPDFADLRAQSRSLQYVVAYAPWGGVLGTGGDEPERAYGADVSADLFPLLGVQPERGRAFTREEDREGGPPVIVISHALWQRRYGGDPDIIGRQVQLAGRSQTIIGVMPAGFQFPLGRAEPTDVWMPFTTEMARTSAEAMTARGQTFIPVIAGLAPGVTTEQASAELNTIAQALEQQYPDTNAARRFRVVSLHEDLVGDVRSALLILLGAVGFVLLIACANVANLLLARSTSRGKEIAIKSALGAGRARIVRQLLTESLLLALCGGAVGLLLAVWGVDALVAASPREFPRLEEIGLDARVLGFTFGVSALTGLFFGLAPALQASKLDLNEALKEGGRGTTAGGQRGRLRGALVVAEVALSLVLLVGAGLLIKSFLTLLNTDLGYSTERILAVHLPLSRRYSQPEQQSAYLREVMERTKALPGVEGIAATSLLPLSGNDIVITFEVEGRPPAAPGAAPRGRYNIVSPEYFNVMGMILQRGRGFSEQDVAGSPGVVIISESLAARYFPDEDPIGKRIIVDRNEGGDPPREIIGIVGDVRHASLEEEAQPEYYLSYLQTPARNTEVVVRAANNDPASLAPAVRAAIKEMNPEQLIWEMRTMSDLVGQSVAPRRFHMLLLGLFAGVALLLAGVGIFGVMNYVVSQRTHEIGVRIALGAQSRDVLKMVVGQGIRLAALGVGIGLAGALAVTRVLASLLYEVSPTDPLVFGSVAALLLAVALAACYIPARRATKVDPMTALRYE